MSDSILGGITSAAGAYYTGQSTAASLDAQAQLNTENAQLATEQGQYDAMRQGMVASQKLGAMRAAYGASGISSTSGSFMDVMQSSAVNAEMDNQNIIHGAAVKAINYENEASMEKLGASNAVTASYLNMFASIAGGSAGTFGSSSSSSNNPSGGTDDTEEAGGEDEMAGGADEMSADAAVV